MDSSGPAPAGPRRTAPGALVVDSSQVSGMVSSITPGPPQNSAFTRVLPPRHAHHIPVEFTGSGAEYFRIWIVNLLLLFLTLGIYYPWAKVRKLRYFYGHTLVGGHPLDFHGEPRRMLRGSMLAGALFGVYSLATEFSPAAAAVAVLAIVLLGPLLLRAALQFRLAHTSWRGLRFGFTGNLGDAYRATVVPMLLVFVVPLLWQVGLDGQDEADALPSGGDLLAQAWLLVLALGVLSLPYFLWRLKRYQHDHFRLGQLQSELRLGPGAVYAACLRILLVLAGPGVLLLALLYLGLQASGSGLPGLGTPGSALLFMLAIFGYLLYLYVAAAPYVVACLQNLFWSRTGNRYVRFRSELRPASYVGLQIRNYLLLVLTLGLYWPWAAVASRRKRLQAVTLVSRVDLDELVMTLRPHGGDAAADVGDDLLGFDIGL